MLTTVKVACTQDFASRHAATMVDNPIQHCCCSVLDGSRDIWYAEGAGYGCHLKAESYQPGASSLGI